MNPTVLRDILEFRAAANRAVWRSESERSLLYRLCQLAISHRLAGLAWAGTRIHYRDNQPDPIVAVRREDGKGGVDAELEEIPAGQEPLVERAIFESVTVCHQIDGVTCAAVPFVSDRHAIGVLVLQDIEFGRDDLEVRAALDSAGEDIGEGIRHIRLTLDALTDTPLAAGERLDVLQSTSKLVAVIDSEGRIRRWNETAERLTGVSLRDVQGEVFWNRFIPSFEIDTFCSALGLFRSKGGPLEIRTGLQAANSTTRQMRWRFRRLNEKDPLPLEYVMLAGKDVSEREKSEEILRQQAEIMDQLHEAVIATDMRGFVTTWNRGAERLFGQSSEQALGCDVSFIYSEKDAVEMYDRILPQVLGMGRAEVEIHLKRRDGGFFLAHMLLTLLRDKLGRPKGIIRFIANVTEQRRVEESQRVLLEGLRGVVRCAHELMAADCLDGLYRLSVEKAREELGVERCGLSILFDGELHGTWGTDENGETADEHDIVFKLEPQWHERLEHSSLGWIEIETERLAFKERPMQLGRGWMTFTAIRTPEGNLHGVFAVDAALSNSPSDTNRQEVIAVYCSLLGDIIQRKRDEQRQRRFAAGLRAVTEATDRLMSCKSLDSMCRLAVELARERLGIERCSIFLREGDIGRGTYGTDSEGRTTNEYGCTVDFDDEWPRETLDGAQRWRMSKAVRTYFDAEAGELRELDEGWIAATPIYDSRQNPVGIFYNDALLSGSPFDPGLQEILAVYCSVLGSVFEQKRSEESLRASETRWRSIVTSIPDFVMRLDCDGRIMDASGASMLAHHHDTLHIRGRCLFELDLLPIKEAELREMVKRVRSGEGIVSRELQIGDGDEATFFELRIGPCGTDETLAICRNITERVRNERERLMLKSRILEAQKLESLGVMAGGIAHDFNNLLSGVIGHAGVVLDELPAEHPLRPEIERIERTALRMSDLTRQMLAYSGRGTFMIERFDLNELIRETSGLLRLSVSKTSEMMLELASEPLVVEGDQTQMRQVLMNLITNASDAIGASAGTIRVTSQRRSISCEEFPPVPWREELRPGLFACVEVSDDGCGMAPETLSRIFEPFFTTKFSGRGLGLASVQGIVRSHRGAILLKSHPGQGTTFRVCIPLLHAEPTPVTPVRKAMASNAWTGEGTVLVVDDEEPVRDVSRRLLEKLGFQVMTASDGVEALEVFKAHGGAFRLVLLDMTMPRMSGEELLDKLRELAPDLPVLLMSGFSEQEAMNRFRGCRFEGFLAKPFRRQDLIDSLEQALAGAPGESEV